MNKVFLIALFAIVAILACSCNARINDKHDSNVVSESHKMKSLKLSLDDAIDISKIENIKERCLKLDERADDFPGFIFDASVSGDTLFLIDS